MQARLREIVLDTETTGFDPMNGDRVVEVGCVELVNRIPTGQNFHAYVNPERDMPRAAFEVHGLSTDFLKDKPLFRDVVADLLDFLGDSHLVAHNAIFDVRFLNSELEAAGGMPLSMERVIDTLALARRRCPGPQHTLDALCRRFGIDNSARTTHGALLDAELLAEVYLELCGGRQAILDLTAQKASQGRASQRREIREARAHGASTDELAAHRRFLEEIPGAIWAQDKAD